MKGFLHLQNGEMHEGNWLTTPPAHDISGEIVFFTGMTGYQEVLTDPSYKDQIIVFTYPLIGNYGINENDFESKQPHVAGVIVYEANATADHYEANYTLVDYLQKWNIPMLGHIDTRAVVKKIREQGSMPASLSLKNNVTTITISEEPKVKEVSTKQPQAFGSGSFHIVLVDFGYKKSIVQSLLQRDCHVTVVPYTTTYEEVKQLNPDGILLSNGPGNPKDVTEQLPEIKKIITHYPTLGICLGHQLVALAFGANTTKLTFGHRGGNHPVCDLQKNKVFMTSQNHSYVVDSASLADTELDVRFINLHDQSVEGLVHKTLPIETVQFHPEANPGPAESAYVFDEFLNRVKANSGRVIAYA